MKILVFIVIVVGFPLAAFSRERLIFHPPASDFRDALITAYITQSYPDTPSPYVFARVDLNADGVPEYIARSTKTREKKPTPYHILSLRRRTVSDWGMITAQKLEISDKKTYGHRHVIVYNDTQNDFYREIWTWNKRIYVKNP